MRRTMEEAVACVIDDALAGRPKPLPESDFEAVREQINSDPRVTGLRCVGPGGPDEEQRNYVDPDGYPMECVSVRRSETGRGEYGVALDFGPKVN